MEYISNLNKEISQGIKSVAVLGSTGTIGQNTLAIIANAPLQYRIFGLAGGKNLDLLAKQATDFRPNILVIQDESEIDSLKKLLPPNYTPTILHGKDGYSFLASHEKVDTVVSAQVGAAGLRATLSACEKGKIICLANKESLVLAGDLIRFLAKKNNALILPVDSEHYAIFQCILNQYQQKVISNQVNEHPSSIKRLILTASGGPFRGKDADFLKTVTKSQALNHPNWSMGPKITIDSASLMNKGLEVIEACHLYGLPIEQVDVLIHPQSIVHSLVEWQDSSMLAQLAPPNMRLPIGACLAWPNMLTQKINSMPSLDLTKQSLHFEEVNHQNFPCLSLAKKAFEKNICVELNAANEVAVELFLKEEIHFQHIPLIVKHVLEEAKTLSKTNHHELELEEEITSIENRDFNARSQAYLFAKNLDN